MIAYQFCFVFRRERYLSADMFSVFLFRRVRNGTIAYRFTFCVTFFGTERFYLKRSRLNAALRRSSFRNYTERNGTIAFPCERGLNIAQSSSILFVLISCTKVTFGLPSNQGNQAKSRNFGLNHGKSGGRRIFRESGKIRKLLGFFLFYLGGVSSSMLFQLGSFA